MKKIKYFFSLLGFSLLLVSCQKMTEYKALIVTGQNTTDWMASTPVLKKILEESGLFTCSIAISPDPLGDMSRFNPRFEKYDVVVINYSGVPWNDDTKKRFADYVRNGGGVIIYHSSSGAFPGWKEYEEICGLTGWGGRSEKDGPYLYYRNNSVVRDTTPGEAGWYGTPKEFEIRVRNSEHPITKGLPVRWMHTEDLLYARLRGPAENMEILATAFCDTTGGGTGRHEPVMMTVKYGNGRVFHTTLGFPGDSTLKALHCAGFITVFQRAAEWAASGRVTMPVPADFPSLAGTVLRPDYKLLTLRESVEGLMKYETGKSTKFYTSLQSFIREASGNTEKLREIEKMMVRVLKNKTATVESRKLILRELSWMGSDYCIPAIKALRNNPKLQDEVEFALERLGSDN